MTMNDRYQNIKDCIELLSILRDKMIIGNVETFDSRLLMWLIEQLQQSLLVTEKEKRND